ncbi:eukaryotic initiation factor 3 [Loa loa]|nr:eukaryotic initiation factor 3 [Loa loa]EFO19417.2 eukaryotic initiation factor 3 [Loa loa]
MPRTIYCEHVKELPRISSKLVYSLLINVKVISVQLPVIMIRIGNHVVIQKMGGEHLRVCKISRKTKILIEKLRFEIDGAIDQPYGLFEVSAGKLTRVAPENITDIAAAFDFDTVSTSSSSKLNGISNAADISRLAAEEVECANAAQVRQKVTQDEIIKMKDTGVPAEQLIARLVDGSASFSERTIYSQNKYINKKAKKHSDHVYLLKPTLRLIAESYYKKDPERVAHLRIDLLSHLLALSGIHYGSRCVVFEQCLGLLTSAVLTRLGGSGACIHLHRGDIAQAIPCVDSMDFDKAISSAFLPLCISNLLEESMEETEELMNQKQGAIIGMDEAGSLSKKDDEAERQQEKEDNGSTAHGDDGEREASTVVDSSLERRTERQRLRRQAWELMRNGEIEILFIASKNINPVEILERTWSSLRLSSTIVIYCPIAEPLYSAYHWLKARHAVQVHIVDAFYRSHQVIQDRSHPIMQQFITGGIILSAVKVEHQ